MLENILLGIGSAFQPSTLLFLILGTFIGLIIGALPGLTGNMAIALMVPVTFAMDPTTGLAFIAAICCSSIYGGLLLHLTDIRWPNKAEPEKHWVFPPSARRSVAYSVPLCCFFSHRY